MHSQTASPRLVARPDLRNFVLAMILGSFALVAAAVAYSRSRHIPATVAVPVALAFLTEFSFYLLLGFPRLHQSARQNFHRPQLAGLLTVTGVLPYLIESLGTGTFSVLHFLLWMAILSAVSCWFLSVPHPPWIRRVLAVAFLVLLAAVILSGILRWIFPVPFPKLPVEVLGHVTLIRTAILASLLFHAEESTGIGFVPRLRDLAIGSLWFGIGAAIAIPLGIRLGQMHLTGRTPNMWQALGLLLGIFWVVALSEEFFFRGLLQQWLARWTGSTAAGLILASLLFGACHLPFRGFPNWRFAILSAILGLVTGAAFLQARSIRASMVTHALAVGAWRLFLS